jgi:hypothetical protein
METLWPMAYPPGSDSNGAGCRMSAGLSRRSTRVITKHALDVLIEAITLSRGSRDDIRRVVVGILDELGLDDPLTTPSRTRLASGFTDR